MATLLHLNLVLIDFNSIKVRLELTEKEFDDLVIMRFQFHKGAIGVFIAGRRSLGDNLFQFHKGAIGVKKLLPANALSPYFNSIKVRLE